MNILSSYISSIFYSFSSVGKAILEFCLYTGSATSYIDATYVWTCTSKYDEIFRIKVENFLSLSSFIILILQLFTDNRLTVICSLKKLEKSSMETVVVKRKLFSGQVFFFSFSFSCLFFFFHFFLFFLHPPLRERNDERERTSPTRRLLRSHDVRRIETCNLVSAYRGRWERISPL